MKEKKCSECKRVFPVTMFNRDKSLKSGYKSQCRSCCAEYSRGYKKRHNIVRKVWQSKNKDALAIISKRYLLKYPEKAKARRVIRTAVSNGAIIKPKICSECNDSGRIEAHHPDYSRPLYVKWLCVPCHRYLHNRSAYSAV